MNILLIALALLLHAKSRLHPSGLVVRAVRARDKFTEFVEAREVTLKIVLLGGSIVELARNDRDDTVRDVQRLVEFLRDSDHLLVHRPRSLRRGDDELLDLLELVYAEDTTNVLTVRAGLLSEARRQSGVTDR